MAFLDCEHTNYNVFINIFVKIVTNSSASLPIFGQFYFQLSITKLQMMRRHLGVSFWFWANGDALNLYMPYGPTSYEVLHILQTVVPYYGESNIQL